MNIFQKAITLISGSPKDIDRPLKSLTERELIELESDISVSMIIRGYGTNSGKTRTAKTKNALRATKYIKMAFSNLTKAETITISMNKKCKILALPYDYTTSR